MVDLFIVIDPLTLHLLRRRRLNTKSLTYFKIPSKSTGIKLIKLTTKKLQ